ncbi:MAG: elongation factor P maturation arginine rhamnosyltransferase EarP [Burkholderiales bacterium]|jgi:uncharacterized repeat protein (TIGR03837 family)
MIWDVFCHVIDNWGDIGVCWRLTADLRARGEDVRLWINAPESLSWMAPQAQGVFLWNKHTVWPEPGDVVIETFGCELPEKFIQRMAQKNRPPAWINLEYLSAEAYVQRSHGLRSPQQGAVSGLAKYFFYPGWVHGTGGLLREQDLFTRQARFDAPGWLESKGIRPHPDELKVSLFCYAHTPVLPSLFKALQIQQTMLLVTAGQADEAVRTCIGDNTQIGLLRIVRMPRLSQKEFDHLLWACDVNFVRGEDSFVRAQWAAKPFVWQIYPQSDQAHVPKLEAFHELWTSQVSEAHLWVALSRAWNDSSQTVTPLPWPATPTEWTRWRAQAWQWAQALWQKDDLTTQLQNFLITKGFKS